VRKATSVLTDEEIDLLEESLTLARREAKPGRYDAHLESDIAMHDMIIQAVDNKLFSHLAQLVGDQSIRIRSLVEAIAPVEEVLVIIDEHCAVLEALRARNEELAHELLVAHLKAGMNRTLDALAKMKENEA
jgi:DNA-binding GntR family transcriptional regulator